MLHTHIRNFSIIAHIDHGKSTLADRFIQVCGGLADREMQAQVLDSMDIERERGITIKAQSVTLNYKARDGEIYRLNFIDTPGHVDFSYEVSRSLKACEGALLIVDASQGVEAQSVANCYTAIDLGLEVVPVLNKIDLPAAEPERVAKEIEDIIGIEAVSAVKVSAKTGEGVEDILEELVRRIPPPEGDPDAPLQALIIDSWFDNFVGVISLVRIMHGTMRPKQKIRVMSTGRNHQVERLGIFSPKQVDTETLGAGDVGYVISGIKDIDGAPVGDTLTGVDNPAAKPVPGFKNVQPRVFAGLFPIEADDYEDFREALSKLRLNDSALHYEPETSQALGFGFRVGFLGMLHMEIVQERLEREYNLDLITTAPTVIYEVVTTKDEILHIDNPASLPPLNEVAEIREPIILANILVPQAHIGPVITLCEEKRGSQRNMQYLGSQVSLVYELPMSEVVLDFFDRLKSVSRGFASFDYQFERFQAAPLGEARLADQWRAGGCAFDHRSSRAVAKSRPRSGRAHARNHPAANVRRGDSGGGGGADYRPHHRQGAAQECDRQVLRRRYHAQEETPGEAKGRQKAHETGGQGRDSPGGLPGGAPGGKKITL